MMEGTAASNSLAVPSGRRNQTGQVSVRNSATPKDSGTAISSAMPALARVPTMAIAAPKSSLTTSHSTCQMNCTPKRWNAGQALMNKETMMPIRAASTSREKNWVMRWKTASCRRWRRAIDSIDAEPVCAGTDEELMVVPRFMGAPGERTGPAHAPAPVMRPGRSCAGRTGLLLDLRPDLGANVVGQAVRQCDVVQIGGHLLAVLEGPVEELQHLGGLCLVARLLVHQDEGSRADGPAVGTLGVDHGYPHARNAKPVHAGRSGSEGLLIRR